MQDKMIFSSECIIIMEKEDGYYIQTLKKGISTDQLGEILDDYPEIEITSIIAVRNALLNAPSPAVKFAERKEKITVEVSEDELSAYITLYAKDKEFSSPCYDTLLKEIIQSLKDNGIIYGIKNDVLLRGMVNNKRILVAEGSKPVNGEDANIKLYELKETKPEVKKDGNVDHYELNLINRVAAGDWVGEKTDPTEGIPGRTVRGNIIKPAKGKDLPLMFDRETVNEVYKDGKTVLYTRINGAVNYDGGRIGVSNHVEINGSIDYKTGNIDFDGYVTIKGTVEDGFSASATKDIEILGDYGIGGVKIIESREGSIYIKGGIAGKGKAVVRSKRDVFTKFISDAEIICDGRVHIGFYCLNSNIKAKEVILDSARGQIIGGSIQAEIKVVASTIGSAGEKRTTISVSGFDRESLKMLLDQVTSEIEKLKGAIAKAKLEISLIGNPRGLTAEKARGHENIKENYFLLRDKMKEYEAKRKIMAGYLRTHGEGEITILKKAYPNTRIEIKGIAREITSPVICASYYVQDGEMKEL